MEQPTGIINYYNELRSINLYYGILLYFPIRSNLTPNKHFSKRFILNYIFKEILRMIKKLWLRYFEH